MSTGAHATWCDKRRRVHAQVARRARRSARARSASSSPASRSCDGAPVGDTHHARRRAGGEAAAGLQGDQPRCSPGLFPVEADDYEALRDALEKLKLNDAALHYEPESLAGARLRLPLRLPRPAAHGHRAGAAGARVRPGPHHHRADGGLRGAADRRHASMQVDNPAQAARPVDQIEEIREPIITRQHPHAAGLRRPGDHAVQREARRADEHAVPRHARCHAQLRAAAGRGRARLLRPAEVGHARLRLARLRVRAIPGAADVREARHPDQRRQGRCAVDHRAPRQRAAARPRAGRQDAAS